MKMKLYQLLFALAAIFLLGLLLVAALLKFTTFGYQLLRSPRAS